MMEMRACSCVGPQNGQPLCPCMMQGVSVVDGRYVRTEDLGPATSDAWPKTREEFLKTFGSTQK